MLCYHPILQMRTLRPSAGHPVTERLTLGPPSRGSPASPWYPKLLKVQLTFREQRQMARWASGDPPSRSWFLTLGLGAAGRRKGTQPRGGKFLKHEVGTRCGERFSVGGQQLKHEWAPLPGPRRGWCSFLYLHVEAS